MAETLRSESGQEVPDLKKMKGNILSHFEEALRILEGNPVSGENVTRARDEFDQAYVLQKKVSLIEMASGGGNRPEAEEQDGAFELATRLIKDLWHSSPEERVGTEDRIKERIRKVREAIESERSELE